MSRTPTASTAARREQQFQALMEAAEKRICESGIDSLKARDLATDIGVALGGLYNLVEDMDALMLRLASRTMKRLDTALSAAADATPLRGPLAGPEAAEARLEGIAHAYYDFARENLQLWRALFEMRLKKATLPEWNISEQLGLIGHIMPPLELLMPKGDALQRAVTGRTLFAAVHGIVVVGLEERLIAVPPQALTGQITWLIRAACRDLRAQSPSQT